MKEIRKRMSQLWKNEEGATATEYAVMLALIIAVAIGTVVFLGEKVEEGFNLVAQTMENTIN